MLCERIFWTILILSFLIIIDENHPAGARATLRLEVRRIVDAIAAFGSLSVICTWRVLSRNLFVQDCPGSQTPENLVHFHDTDPQDTKPHSPWS
jgi:hypothetical protein